MVEMDMAKELGRKGADAGKIAGYVIKQPGCIESLIEGLKASKGTLRYGCEKVLRLVSEKRPGLIYPYFDLYSQLLDSDNSFLKWGAILTIANLAGVDSDGKFDKIFNKYYLPVTGPVMITAANIIGGSAKIALARPELIGRITKEILKVEKAKFVMRGSPSPECRNVAIGHAIDSFDQFFGQIDNKAAVIKFVKKQLKNTRKAVVKKAEKFLQKHSM
jgi:hypothetical protein